MWEYYFDKSSPCQENKSGNLKEFQICKKKLIIILIQYMRFQSSNCENRTAQINIKTQLYCYSMFSIVILNYWFLSGITFVLLKDFGIVLVKLNYITLLFLLF